MDPLINAINNIWMFELFVMMIKMQFVAFWRCFVAKKQWSAYVAPSNYEDSKFVLTPALGTELI